MCSTVSPAQPARERIHCPRTCTERSPRHNVLRHNMRQLRQAFNSVLEDRRTETEAHRMKEPLVQLRVSPSHRSMFSLARATAEPDRISEPLSS